MTPSNYISIIFLLSFICYFIFISNKAIKRIKLKKEEDLNIIKTRINWENFDKSIRMLDEEATRYEEMTNRIYERKSKIKWHRKPIKRKRHCL